MRWHEESGPGYVCGGRMGWGVGAALVIGFATEGPRLVTCIHKCIERHFNTLGNSVWV